MDNLFELLYYAYTEYNSVETLEFKAMIDPLSEKLKDLASNDDEADEYMGSYSACVPLMSTRVMSKGSRLE